MCYFSSTIAGYFIDKSNREGAPLSVLQVIKLVYISHGWCLALNGSPLILDKIEAWKYGPVMPSLHRFFEEQGLKKDTPVHTIPSEEANCIKPIHRELLNKVYAKYKHFSGDDLTELLHHVDTPWFRVWNDGNGKDQRIEDEDTQAYYSRQITRDSFDLLSEYPSIESEEEAIRFLRNAGILMEDGNLNPIYRNN